MKTHPSRQLWFLQPDSQSLQSIIPAISACAVLAASVLPWLRDPYGTAYSAWTLPVDIGWQLRTGFLNYGLLCLCSSLYTLLVACANWRPFKGCKLFVRRHVLAGVFCALPVALFLYQYLCVDVQVMALLAQHKAQTLLAQQHFGYRVPAQLVPLNPFTLSASTLWGRLQLLIDQASLGPLLLSLGAWLVLDYQRLFKLSPAPRTSQHRLSLFWLAIGLSLLIVLLGRAPAAMLCDYEAKALLSSGSYSAALNWLAVARFLNPALDHVYYYHVQRGQALYFLAPARPNVDSRLYLAYMYRDQRDYLDAYQQLLPVWQANPAAPWVVDELSRTLERLTETAQPLNDQTANRQRSDESALPWLRILIKVDPSAVYALYMTGRIHYDLHDYAVSMQVMSQLLRISSDADIQSSAYTYMALSDAVLGDYVNSRILLFKALALDPNYRNNIAREELSGLR